MPTYDYKCEKCEHQFEVFQSMKDDRLTDCPLEDCDGRVKRLLGTGAGIIFKGSGFYETDYRSDSYKAAAKADSGEGSGGGDSGKADSGKGGKTGEGAKSDSGGTGGSGSSKSESSSSSSGSKPAAAASPSKSGD